MVEETVPDPVGLDDSAIERIEVMDSTDELEVWPRALELLDGMDDVVDVPRTKSPVAPLDIGRPAVPELVRGERKPGEELGTRRHGIAQAGSAMRRRTGWKSPATITMIEPAATRPRPKHPLACNPWRSCS